MKNIFIITILILFINIELYSTTVNGRFVVLVNNGSIYSVKVQINTDTGTDDLGGSTIVFNFNNTALSFPVSPQNGVDYTYHNFSGGNYSPATVTLPRLNQIWLNIELNIYNAGTVVATTPLWTDVVTINFTTINPLGNAGLIWQKSSTFIFDGDNATLWINGTFTDENTSPLPVELTSFTATADQNTVNLKWVTKTEVNNSGFNVERKINDGQWNTIGFVEGSGTATESKEYSFTDKDLSTGGSKFQYRLKQLNYSGSYEYSDIVEVEVLPTMYELSQNYPNPFNPSTTIRFSLPEETQLKINIYNMLGELVETLAQGTYEAGYHQVTFSAIGGSASGGNAANLASGMYIYRIESDAFVQVKKMILVQ
ncbi:MAG TPA: T9SS type A sorting domain-containing protein [Ignavibacteriaceae bacterium]|nr:MAG: hypothetical protein BWY38_03003 [Ignavibacteria bacterium ADurb.Bin266]HQF43973.1 T9SS type A sorting domain-containing protein [Ignavibacteriaceae bacterium]